MNATTNRARARFAGELRAALEEKGVSVRALAKQLNPENPETSRSSLMRWLRGAHLPSRTTRRRLALALDLPADHFAGEDDAEDDDEADPAVMLLTAIKAFVRAEFADHLSAATERGRAA